MTVSDYRKLMDRLLEMPACALLTTGRTGTDLLQSLLDSHPEVLVFIGSFFYHKFWNNSVCVAAGDFELSDFVDEFIGKHIGILQSKYDITERRNQLGDDHNQSVSIDLGEFKSGVTNLLSGREINSKNSMIAIYAAYAMCLGQDIEKKTLLLHHLHHAERLGNYLKDFPDSKIICMTRDPRANFVSGIEHWRKFDPSTDQGSHLHFYIKRILEDATVLEKYNNEYIAIRIEDIGRENVLRKLCKWLNISYNRCLMKSTWGGLTWHGDRLSEKRSEGSGWSAEMLKNRWETRLSFIDKYVLNYIMFYRLRYYGYSYQKISILDSIVMPFLILLPLSYEWRFISFSYIRDCLRDREYLKITSNVIFYRRRVGLFMQFYSKITRREKFNQPFLSCE